MIHYYQIDSRKDEGDATLFSVTLLPDYNAYTGHFPDNPVAPGVCNIQMIKDCAELLTGRRLLLAYIDKCKFSAMLSPQTTPQLSLRMQLSETYKVRATLFDSTTTYLEFKGELTTEHD